MLPWIDINKHDSVRRNLGSPHTKKNTFKHNVHNYPCTFWNLYFFFSHKALDFWITYIHNQESLLSRHYDPESFLYLSATAGRKLLLDLTTALQPLAQLPLRLEYHYEYNQLQQQEQRRLADYLLDKHVAEAEESHIESHQALINQQNMYSEQTQAAAQSQVDLVLYFVEQYLNEDYKNACFKLLLSQTSTTKKRFL